MNEYLYTVDEISKILKINRNSAYDLISMGVLRAMKLGRLKVTRTSLLTFLKEYNGKDLSNLEHIKELNVKSNAVLYNKIYNLIYVLNIVALS